MSLRASIFAFLLAAGVLASASADAAGLAPNFNIRSPAIANTTTLAPGRTFGSVPYAPPLAAPTRPRFTEFNSNDQFDTNGNLNPGGGGGGVKPGKKPYLQ